MLDSYFGDRRFEPQPNLLLCLFYFFYWWILFIELLRYILRLNFNYYLKIWKKSLNPASPGITLSSRLVEQDTNKSIQYIRLSWKKSDFSLDLWHKRGTVQAHISCIWRSPNLHVGQACFFIQSGHCAQLINTCMRQNESINCICLIINTKMYLKIIIWHHGLVLESKEPLKSLDYVEWKSAQCLQSLGWPTQEAEERGNLGSAWPSYSMFPLSGSNFTLSVPFALDFIWIFKVYYITVIGKARGHAPYSPINLENGPLKSV